MPNETFKNPHSNKFPKLQENGKIEKERFWLLCMLTNLIVCPLKKVNWPEHLNSKKGSFKAKHFYLTKNF